MKLKVYDSLRQKKELFEPIEPGKVRMYCCGPTVYDYLHIGNFRGAVFYNFLRNWLVQLGYEVKFAYNFTDVDDKILKRAEEEGVSASEISEKYIAEFKVDFAGLKLSPHDFNPKVTDHMGDIVDLIERLIANGRAYEVEGEVFYSIKDFAEYGKLSHRKPEDMMSGARVEVDPKKRNPLDFTLWKPAKDGEASWDSPWGPGRPGWHIECSAMNQALFGDQIDIHGGGMDLIFPHHENEIAQSEGASNTSFVKYWIHNNMFTFSGAKMSKSLGNVRTMRSFLEEYNGEIFKYLVMSAHYRSEIEFSEQTINNSIAALARVYSALVKAESYADSDAQGQGENYKTFASKISEAKKISQEAFCDDFATPTAMAQMFEVVRLFNQLLPVNAKKNNDNKAIANDFIHFIGEFGKPMELFQEPPRDFLRIIDDMLLRQKDLSRNDIDQLVARRLEARKNKDYTAADKARDELEAMGIEIRDTVDGTEWEVRKG